MAIHLLIIDLDENSPPIDDDTVNEVLGCFDETADIEFNAKAWYYQFSESMVGQAKTCYVRLTTDIMDSDCIHIGIRGLDPRKLKSEVYGARMSELAWLLLRVFSDFPYERNTSPQMTADGWSFLGVYPDMNKWSDFFARCERVDFHVVNR